MSYENENFLIKTQSNSRIPSFLNLNFDSNIKLNNLLFIRKFDANNMGTLKILRNNDNYSWEARNLPLDELEISTNTGLRLFGLDISNKKSSKKENLNPSYDSGFDRISGSINGSGTLSNNLSEAEGKVDWKYGKFRDFVFRSSYFE